LQSTNGLRYKLFKKVGNSYEVIALGEIEEIVSKDIQDTYVKSDALLRVVKKFDMIIGSLEFFNVDEINEEEVDKINEYLLSR
jgi:hypothetical protein